MISADLIRKQLEHTIGETDLTGLGQKIQGKVRDCYIVGGNRVIVTTDRLSAFDRVITTIPFKGQVLSQLAVYWFNKTKHIIDNHLISTPHPNVMITTEAEVLPVEVVVRGYITGSAWRDYQAGRPVSGIALPSGLKKSEKFKCALLTPSTKAAHGEHDLPISSEEILKQGLVNGDLWKQVEEKALALFAFATEEAAKRNLILVDTKYEFGTVGEGKNRKLILVDEVHTPDSSRYWIANTYAQRFAAGADPDMLDKEFVRRKLMELGYMGDGEIPVLNDDFRVETAQKYISTFERLTGEDFVPAVESLDMALANLGREQRS